MKYKGKYSLNENLLKGKGMRLLKEMPQARSSAFGNTWAAECRVATHLGADLNDQQKKGKFTPPGNSSDIVGQDCEVKSGSAVTARKGAFAGERIIRLEAELTKGLGDTYESDLSQAYRFIKRSIDGRMSKSDFEASVGDFRLASQVGTKGKGRDGRGEGYVPSVPDMEKALSTSELGLMVADSYLMGNATVYVVDGEDVYEFPTAGLSDKIGIGSLEEYRYNKKTGDTSGFSYTLELPLEHATKHTVTNAEASAHIKAKGGQTGGKIP